MNHNHILVVSDKTTSVVLYMYHGIAQIENLLPLYKLCVPGSIMLLIGNQFYITWSSSINLNH